MYLVLLSGFLGSGKTTLVTKLAQFASSRGQRVAIIVNEIGEIGLDNQLLRQLDLNVWELVNGCICCTLSADLITTLHTLDADYAPDLVLVEPSGAADPRTIRQALPFYRGRPLVGVRTLAVLDAQRLPILIEVLTPLIVSQIQHADVVLISKCDLASPDELAQAQAVAREHAPGVPVIEMGAASPILTHVAELRPWLS